MSLSARSRKEDVVSSGQLPSQTYILPTLVDTMNPGIALSSNRVTAQYGLFESIKHQRYRQALLLVEAGVHIDSRNEQGQTPLIFVCTNVGDNQKLRAKFVQLFLRAGSDPNLQDWKGLTAIMHACLLEQLETTVALAEHPHTDLMLQDQKGNTALMHAVTKGNLDIVAVLLNALRQVYINLGPALDHKNLDGQRAIDLAKKYEYHDIIKLLNLAVESPEKILELSLPDSRLDNNEDDDDHLVDEGIFYDSESVITVVDRNPDELPKTTNPNELPSISNRDESKAEDLRQPSGLKFGNRQKDTEPLPPPLTEQQPKPKSKKSGILPLLSLSSLDVPASEPWEWDVGIGGKKVKPGKRGTITGSRSLTDSRGKLSDSPMDPMKHKQFCVSSDQLNASFGGFSKLDGSSASFQRLTSTELLNSTPNKEGLHLPPIRTSLKNYQKTVKTPIKKPEENGQE